MKIIERITKALLLICLSSAVLSAQTQPQKNSSKTESQPQAQSQLPVAPPPELKENNVRLLLDKIEITGQLEKPQAVFIVPGSSPEIDDIEINRSFFEEIFRPIDKKGRVTTKMSQQPQSERKNLIPW